MVNRLEMTILFLVLAAVVASAETASPAFVGIVHSDQPSSWLYELDIVTADLDPLSRISVSDVCGLALADDGFFYALTSNLSDVPNSLLRVDPATGMSAAVGSVGVDIVGISSSLAFDHTSSLLYMIACAGIGDCDLYTIDRHTAAPSLITAVDGVVWRVNAMAFSPEGGLYVYESTAAKVTQIDKTTGDWIATSYPTDPVIEAGNFAGMAFHPVTGTLYVAGGWSGGTPSGFYEVDLYTDTATRIGGSPFRLNGATFTALPSVIYRGTFESGGLEGWTVGP